MLILPKQEGISGLRQREADEDDGAPLSRLKRGATLTDLTNEYALFSYAPLFLYGDLQHNPVQEWINQTNVDKVVFILQLDKPVLHIGAGPVWDHILWAVVKDHWPSLSLHLGSIGIIDRAQRKFTRVVCQELPIPDVAAKTLTTNPMVTITTFSVDSNKGCLVFAPASLMMKGRPFLQFNEARAETIAFADALLAESANPYGQSPEDMT